ncbi:alpha/beta fold hydrolase [Candidatus Berkelbacteria bacterium]|nr:alpha/beta fold hydrolase [Candidatus Berkelbacteria bacterium]
MTKSTLQADGETLSVLTLGELPVDLIWLHGGGKSTKERSVPMAEKLLARGVSSVTFDHSGHGESTGQLSASSLQRRDIQARGIIENYAAGRPRILVGSSMGGHTALSLLPQYPSVELIVLFAPAVYARESQNASFTDEFGEIIRQHESWKNSPALDALKAYTGNLLVYIGERDQVIPHPVIDAIDAASAHVTRKNIVWFPDCPHGIRTWLNVHPDQERTVINMIVEYLQ